MSASPLVSVPTGDVLTVSAEAGGYATVWQEGTKNQWSVGAKTPLRLGPGLYRVETVRGQVSHSVDSQAIAALNATLPRATDIVRNGAALAQVINQGSAAMALKDKFARLADRAKAVPAALGERADTVLDRLASVETRGDVALTKLDAVVTDAEQAAAAAEDAVSQITNQ